MIRRPPRSTRPDTLFPYTTLFRSLMARSIAILQRGFLSPAEIEASRAVMGLDKTLIADRTYWLASIDETLAGCGGWSRSEEHTSELQSLMRISYAVFCLKKKKIILTTTLIEL